MGSDSARAPSAFWRGVLALGLLVAFYAVTLAISLALLAAGPCLFLLTRERMNGPTLIVTFACTVIPGLVVLRSLLVRPPRFIEPGPRLLPADAPALFETLERIAARSGIRAPDEVYISPLLRVGVTERGGIFGFGARRVLIVGAVAFAVLEVCELEAVLGHELGHYLGGDTRLAGVTSYTTALFASILNGGHGQSTNAYVGVGLEVARTLSRGLGSAYARLYFGIMRPIGRRLELAADAHAVRIAGRSSATSALSKIALRQRTWHQYLQAEVGPVLDRGVLPVDLLAGFDAYEGRLHARGGLEAIRIEIDHALPDSFDTHPTLADRLAFIQAQPDVEVATDRRPATSLLPHAEVIHAQVFEATRRFAPRPESVLAMPWADVPAKVLEPAHAREASELLARRYAQGQRPTVTWAYAQLVEELARGQAAEVVFAIEPELRALAPRDQATVVPLVAEHMLGRFFLGALLECGGRIVLERGESDLLVELGERRIAPLALAHRAMKDDAVIPILRDWTVRLTA